MTEWQISTKKPVIPNGSKKYRHDRAGYKPTVLGKTVSAPNPVWAEKRIDKNALFRNDRVYFVLYTFVDYPV